MKNINVVFPSLLLCYVIVCGEQCCGFWPVRPVSRFKRGGPGTWRFLTGQAQSPPNILAEKKYFSPFTSEKSPDNSIFSRTTVLWSTIEPPIITPQQFYGVNTLQNAHCASSPVSPRARVIHLWQSSSLGLKFKTRAGRCEHFHSSRSYCQIETEQMSMWSSRSSWRSSTRCSPWLSSDSPQKLPVGTHAAITKVSF